MNQCSPALLTFRQRENHHSDPDVTNRITAGDELQPALPVSEARPMESAAPPAERTRSNPAQRVQMVIDHMQQNIHAPLRIAQLSAIAGVSSSQLHLMFKRVAGSSPIGYFIRLRMQRACELLQERKLVKETAGALGYKDPFYFSRIFKAVVGASPREYRKTFLQREQNPAQSSVVQ